MQLQFFAKKMVRYPMYAAIIGVAVNVIAATVFVKTPIVNLLGVGSVSAATALGIISAAVSIVVFMCIKLRGVINRNFVKNILLLLLSALLSAAAMFGAKTLLGSVGSLLDVWNCGLLSNLAVCFIVFVPGVLIYLLAMKILRVRFTEVG